MSTQVGVLRVAEAAKVIGWARSHYLSSTILPSIEGDRLIIPRERYLTLTSVVAVYLVDLILLALYYYCLQFCEALI